jgi:hypothetical protein
MGKVYSINLVNPVNLEILVSDSRSKSVVYRISGLTGLS